MVKIAMKIPRDPISGHQNAWALNPNMDKIVAAGTSISTPNWNGLVSSDLEYMRLG
jgi:hypothetical protein